MHIRFILTSQRENYKQLREKEKEREREKERGRENGGRRGGGDKENGVKVRREGK